MTEKAAISGADNAVIAVSGDVNITGDVSTSVLVLVNGGIDENQAAEIVGRFLKRGFDAKLERELLPLLEDLGLGAGATTSLSADGSYDRAVSRAAVRWLSDALGRRRFDDDRTARVHAHLELRRCEHLVLDDVQAHGDKIVAALQHVADTSTRLGDDRMLAEAKHKLGMVQYSLGHLSQASENHEAALTISEADKTPAGRLMQSIACCDLAAVKAMNGDMEHAHALLELGHQLAADAGSATRAACVDVQQGVWDLLSGRPDDALRSFDAIPAGAWLPDSEIRDPLLFVILKKFQGIALALDGDATGAERTLRRALKASGHYGFDGQVRQVSRFLAALGDRA